MVLYACTGCVGAADNVNKNNKFFAFFDETAPRRLKEH